MHVDAHPVQATAGLRVAFYLTRGGAIAGTAGLVVAAAYLFAWALRHGMADVAMFVGMLGCLTMCGLAVLASMLGKWAWAFVLSCLAMALLTVFMVAAVSY